MKNIVLLFVLLIYYTSINAQLKIGDNLPIITLSSHLNKEVRLLDYKGKIILIDFWASWCGPCRKANKKLVALYNKHKDQDFEIVAISLDTDLTKWINAIAKDKLQYTQLIDPYAFDAKSAVQFGVEALPASYLFDATGILIAINPSETDILNQLNHNKK